MIDRRYESGKSFVMYSKEELEAAQRTDMVTFLESHEGFNFKSSGGWYVGIEHDSLKINPDRYTWHWYSRDLYGKGAIDWLCKVDGYDFKDEARAGGSSGNCFGYGPFHAELRGLRGVCRLAGHSCFSSNRQRQYTSFS